MDHHSQSRSDRPSLRSLPSEIRRQIVSYLAPDPQQLRRGSKRHLKNANLAHSCLREWVTEYMFRDMALVHVLPGMSSHLEVFAVSRENAELLKLVKHIVVQVPPAVRWEVGLQSPFLLHMPEIVKQRLCKRFRVKNVREMSESQIQYCTEYHRAMIEPFTNNRRWHQLLSTANGSWGRVFRSFENLEEISVGICERVDQPRPTYTNTFVLQHGPLVVEDTFPQFVEDSAVNTGWASSVISRLAPPTVRSLHLSMANMDNYNSVATVNRILSISYRCPDIDPRIVRITRLSLSFRGVAGIHGDRDWHGDTGSAGGLRFWKNTLSAFHMLQHLELRNELSINEEIRFSELERSDTKASLLECILPGLVLTQLRTLRLCDFLLDKDTTVNTLSGHWPRLETIMFEDVQLMMQYPDGSISFDLDHVQGQSWVNVCSGLLENYPGVKIELHRPVSNINNLDDYRLHHKYIEKLQHLGGVRLDLGGSYGSLVKLAKEQWDGEQEPLLPDVPTTTL